MTNTVLVSSPMGTIVTHNHNLMVMVSYPILGNMFLIQKLIVDAY